MNQQQQEAKRVAARYAEDYQADVSRWVRDNIPGQPAPEPADYFEKAILEGIEQGVEFAAVMFDKGTLGAGQIVSFGIGNNRAIRKYAGKLPPNPYTTTCNACEYPRPADCPECEGSGWAIVSRPQQATLQTL